MNEIRRQKPNCKYCQSDNVIKYGKYKNTQRYFCKDCKRKFANPNTIPKMQTPIIQVASALSMFYEGMSLHGIRRNLEQTYRNYPSSSTIYEWIVRFTKLAVKLAKDYKPNVGDVWVADEMVLKIEGDKVWFWDLIDSRTRFLLASHMSPTRTTHDARVLLGRAAGRAEKPPKEVITDRLQAYIDGIELNFGAETKHIQAKGLNW